MMKYGTPSQKETANYVRENRIVEYVDYAINSVKISRRSELDLLVKST